MSFPACCLIQQARSLQISTPRATDQVAWWGRANICLPYLLHQSLNITVSYSHAWAEFWGGWQTLCPFRWPVGLIFDSIVHQLNHCIYIVYFSSSNRTRTQHGVDETWPGLMENPYGLSKVALGFDSLFAILPIADLNHRSAAANILLLVWILNAWLALFIASAAVTLPCPHPFYTTLSTSSLHHDIFPITL